MSRSRWARRAIAATVLVVASLGPVVLKSPPASATHTGASLQVVPEVSDVQVGTLINLTVRLQTLLGLPQLQPLQVNFHYEGGPLGTVADQSCTVQAGSTSCTLSVVAQTAGSTLVRAWIDGVARDATEGRLAAAGDCLPADQGESANCAAGDPITPGSVAEPDDTDVVRVTWRDRGVDAQPDNQSRTLTETANLTAAAYNINGQPASNVQVKWEFFDASVSDPGGGNTPATPDRTCTTGANGACTITVASPSTDGIDLLCVWTSTATPNMSGKVTDTGTCGSEVLFDLSANDGVPSPVDDSIDIVRILWGNATPTTTPISLPPTTAGTSPPVPPAGYWLVASDGGIFAFGDAQFKGSTGAIKLNQPITGMSPTPTRNGYFLVASDGGVFAFGDAVFRGSTGAIKLNQPMVGIASTVNGGGYWMVAKDGGIFAFGNAQFKGSTGGIKLAQPIVGLAPTHTGNGYYLVAADGGVFAFGDAVFRGSTGGIKLAKPVVGMTVTPTGLGYYLVASDGGVFAFGDAVFRGSTGGIKLNAPIVGMSRSASGGGYRLVATDGGVFAFGDAPFKGSTGAIKLNRPIVGMAGF